MYRMDKIREWFSYSFGGLTAMGGILSLNDWLSSLVFFVLSAHLASTGTTNAKSVRTD